MGRKTPDDTGLIDEAPPLDPWRVAKLRIVTGVPGLIICLLAPVLIYKKVGLPLEGAPFWLFYAVVSAVFGGYFVWVVFVAWRDKRALLNPPTVVEKNVDGKFEK